MILKIRKYRGKEGGYQTTKVSQQYFLVAEKFDIQQKQTGIKFY